MNQYQLGSVLGFFNDEYERLAKPKKIWTQNTKKNWDLFSAKDGIWKLHGILEAENEKAVVVIGASPCLLENLDELKSLDKKYFLTITVNSALKVLFKNGIIPDYVAAVDGSSKTLVDDLTCDNKDLTLLCSNNVAPEIFDVWKGKTIWIPYYALNGNWKKKLRSRLGRIIPMGGNTFSTAVSIAYLVFGAKIFVFVGSELCYDKRYYPHKKSKWEDPKSTHFVVEDILGRKRYTNIPLFQYKMWMERHMTELSGECVFYDTSFGLLGTDCTNVISTSLRDAKGEITQAFKTKEGMVNDWRLREKLRYDKAYVTAQYIPENGKQIYEQLLKVYDLSKINTVLDVGCGIGQGVAMLRNEGKEAWGIDISENIKPYWEMGNISQFCKVACADNIPWKDNYFDLVVCTEVMEHIPEEGVMGVLKEIYRVGKRDFVFTVAIQKSYIKMPHDGSEPHICVKDIGWWKERFIEAGYNVMALILNKAQCSISVGATKKNGSNLPSDNLFLQLREKVPGGLDKSPIPCRY